MLVETKTLSSTRKPTSAEVHPSSLLLEDMIHEIFDDEDISHIDFESPRNGDDSNMDLLAELFQI